MFINKKISPFLDFKRMARPSGSGGFFRFGGIAGKETYREIAFKGNIHYNDDKIFLGLEENSRLMGIAIRKFYFWNA